MSKRYRKKRKASSSDWQRLAEESRLRAAYLQFVDSVHRAQEQANVRASHTGLSPAAVIDLREAGRILSQYPQLVSYLQSVRELQEAQEMGRTLPLDALKSSPTGNSPQAPSIGGWGASYLEKNVPQGVPNARQLRDWVDADEWVNAAITYYCDRVARSDVAIVPVDEKKPYNRATEKTLQLLLEQPNELGDTWPSLLRMGIRDFFTLGRLILTKSMNAKRQPTALYAEDAALMRIYPAWNGDPAEPRWLYTSDDGRTKVPLRNDEVLAVFDNLATFRYSYSRVQALRNTILADLKASESAARMVDQKPPPHLVQIPGATESQIRTLRATYDADLAGRREILFLGGPNAAQVKSMVYSLKDQQWMEWMEYLVRKIAVTFGLSLTHFSFTGDVNRATSITQQDIVEDRGLVPLLLLIEEHMNRQVVADFAPRLSGGRTNIWALNLRFLFPEVSEIARMLHAAQVVDLATRSLAGLPSMTLNMVLTAMGEPPVPSGGDTFWVSTKDGPMPWLSYEGDLTSYTPPLSTSGELGAQDASGGPSIDESSDQDMGKTTPDDEQEGAGSAPQPAAPVGQPAGQPAPSPANGSEAPMNASGYVDRRHPGMRWRPAHTARVQKTVQRDPPISREETEARKQVESVVRRIFEQRGREAEAHLRTLG